MPPHTDESGQKSRTSQHQVLGRMRSNRNPCSLPVGIPKGTATSEDSLVVSYKTKYVLARWSGTCAHWYLCKSIEMLRPPKNLLTGVYRSFVYHCQTWKHPGCPSRVGEWINKLGSMQTKGYHSELKRNEPSSHERHGGALNAYD